MRGGRSPSVYLLIVFLALPITVWIVSAVLLVTRSAVEFAGFPTNGALQLFNPLRRLAAGQTAGVDFQFFHGIGIPFLHYPLFALFGGSVYASELARHLVSPVLFGVSIALVSWVAAPPGNGRALFISLAVGAAAFWGLDSLMYSGNALEGVRSVMPVVLFAVLYSAVAPVPKGLVSGLCLSLALALGTEHGIATALGLVGASILVSLASRKSWRQNGLFLGTILISFAAFGAMFYLLMGGGLEGALGALRYNLAEVPRDQIWYFGVPPNSFADTWVVLILVVPLFVPLVIAGGSLLLCLREFHKDGGGLSSRNGAMVFFLCYGMLSTLPYLSRLTHAYHQPLHRVLIILALVAGFGFFQRHRERLLSLLGDRWYAAAGLAALGMFALQASVSQLAVTDAPVNLRTIGGSGASLLMPHLADHWRQYTDQSVEAIDAASKLGAGSPSIWSTYAGLAGVHYQVLQPAEDFIIHALGPERRARYIQTFRREQPRFVETMRKSWFVYEEWLQNEHWDFYEDVLNNYQPLVVTEHSIWWVRKETPWTEAPSECERFTLEGRLGSFEIPQRFTTGQSFVIVALRHRIQNPWSPLPLIGSLPRYLVIADNTLSTTPVSLTPYETEMRFGVPLAVDPAVMDGAPRLRFVTRSPLPLARYEPEEVCLRSMRLPASLRFFLAPYSRKEKD